MSKADLKFFAGELQQRGLLEYGSVIDTDTVHELLGLQVPETGTRQQFRKLELAELAAIDYVREQLLKVGKYITSTPSGYRVLLPSENAAQIDLYLSAAARKIRRARMLSQTTPAEHQPGASQTNARAEMMQSSLDSRYRPGQIN